MKLNSLIRYRFCLLLAALIWGGAFAAQVMGMEYMGPFAYNAVRFFIGAASLLPVILLFPSAPPPKKAPMPFWTASFCAGFLLFGGASLQQAGLLYTTASKASFITALYIILVPLIGLFFGHILRLYHAAGAVLALAGIYLLSVGGNFQVNRGDFLVFLCAFFFAFHILLLSWLSERYIPVRLAAGQFLIAALFNSIGFLWEPFSFSMLENSIWTILYTGILSTGVAYTLQVVGQKYVPPSEASMLLSMEMIFGALSGVLFLGESLTAREWAGAALTASGAFLSQLPSREIYHPLSASAEKYLSYIQKKHFFN